MTLTGDADDSDARSSVGRAGSTLVATATVADRALPNDGGDDRGSAAGGNGGQAAAIVAAVAAGADASPFPARQTIGGATRIVAMPGSVLALPANTDLGTIRLAGANLIITLPDGSTLIVEQGAVFVPRLVVDGVQIPADNVASLLIGQEPRPDAGPPQSSGGRFTVADARIEAAVPLGNPTALGDLLAPTDLGFTQVLRSEAFPAIRANTLPTVVVTTADQAGAQAATLTLAESGLPARGAEPAGSNPAPAAITATGTIAFAGDDAPLAVAIDGTAIVAVGQTITDAAGVLTITAIAPGAIGYRYALTDNSLATAPRVFAIRVTDGDGDAATATLTVAITDDAPIARAGAAIEVTEGQGPIGGTVLANVIAGADGARLSAVTIGGATVPIDAGTTRVTTANGVYAFDPDGNWSFAPVAALANAAPVDAGFGFTVVDGDGDQASATQPIALLDGAGPAAGAAVTLALDERDLPRGSTPDGPDTRAATIAFTAGSDGIASIGFGEDLARLDQAFDWTRESDARIVGRRGGATIVTLDLVRSGDSAQVTATLVGNAPLHPIAGDDVLTLGAVDIVASDDDGDRAVTSVAVTLADDVPTTAVTSPVPAGALEVAEARLVSGATADFAVLFSPSYAADGIGPPPLYTLAVAPGATGLVDVASGLAVTLSVADNVVIGSAGDARVFTLGVDAAGQATLIQYRAVAHADPANREEVGGLDAATLITLTQIITDGDGDTAAATVAIGGALAFRDDGPAITVAATGEAGVTLTTQDARTTALAGDSVSTGADFGGVFAVSNAAFGGDGAGAIDRGFALAVANPVAGLTSGGAAITLFLIGGVVTAATAADAALVDSGNTVFTIAVAADGGVTLSQFAAIDHAGPATSGAFDARVATLAEGLVTLSTTATIVDRDGDQAVASATIDLGGKVRFADTGPTIAINASPPPTLDVVEGTLALDATASFAGVFDIAIGADDAGASIGYTLSAVAGPSGLVESRSGEPINLSVVDGEVRGVTSSGLIAFTLGVDAQGVVTLDQRAALAHGATDATDTTLTLAAGLVRLTATVIDGDGDQADATIDIGDRLNFVDDVPRPLPDGASTTESGSAIIGTVLANDDIGADTPGRVVAIGGTPVAAGPAGTTIATLFGSLTINADGGYRYVPGVSVPDGSLDRIAYVVADADGDRAEAALQFRYIGDVFAPAARSVSITLDDDGLPGGVASGAGDVVGTGNEAIVNSTLGYGFGGDGPAASGGFAFDNGSQTVGVEPIDYSWDAVSNVLTGQVRSGVRQGTILFTVAVEPTSGNYVATLRQNVLHAPVANENNAGPLALNYTLTDSDGSTARGTLRLVFNDDIPALGTIQNGTASNNPNATTLTRGALNFAAGADGLDTTTLSANVAGLSSGGRALVTQQVGSVLTGYADNDFTGTVTAGDSSVFTLTIDPAAGPSGQYAFDLTAPLDPALISIPITTGSASGPMGSIQTVSDALGRSLALVSGWQTAGGGFNAQRWFDGTDPLPAGLTLAPLGGSAGRGWGVGNGNFNTGEFLRFDFGSPSDDFDAGGPYAPPSVTLPEVRTASFNFSGFQTQPAPNSSVSVINLRVHYSDGSSVGLTVSGTGLNPTTTLTAPAGRFIDWVDMYASTANNTGRVALTSVGVLGATTDRVIPFTVRFADRDGDAVTGSFNVAVSIAANGGAAAPVALDLDGDGVRFLARAAGVSHDYGAGAVATAWVAPEDGLLARAVEGRWQIAFATPENAAPSDLAAIAADFDGNLDGQLTAADSAFASFGVWQDADSDGTVDPGEFQSLAARGIVAIGLVGDGQVYGAADNDVTVLGHASFTRADGTSGTAVDAVFAIGATGDVVLGDIGALARQVAIADGSAEQRADGAGPNLADIGAAAVLPRAAEVDALLAGLPTASHDGPAGLAPLSPASASHDLPLSYAVADPLAALDMVHLAQAVAAQAAVHA